MKKEKLLTVPELTPSKSDQRKARAAAEWAYNGRSTTYSDIYDAYTMPSAAKVRARENCKKLCKEYDGHALTICGRSTMAFSALFQYMEGNRPCYCYITKDYTRHAYAD